MTRGISLLLLLLAFGSPLLPFAEQDSASDGSTHPVCTTCKGEGRAVLSCDVCAGDGDAPCVDCASTIAIDAEKRQLEILRAIDPEKAQDLEELDKQLAKLESASLELVGGFKPGSKPGCLPCPAHCKDGKSFLNFGHACKACATKGFVKCKACQGKGEARCQMCRGKRSRELPCPECAGRGVAPDPLKRTADAATCAWCEDKHVLPCRVCESGQREQVCAFCRGVGDVVCDKCSGATKAGCNKCSGTGDLSAYLGAKASNKCDKCRETGVIECSACRNGRIACGKCAGEGRLTTRCPICVSTGHAPCGGCRLGSDLAWTITGERLAAAGAGAAAVAHFDVALARVEARNAERVRAFAGSEKERQAFAKQLAGEVSSLKKRRAQLAKQFGL